MAPPAIGRDEERQQGHEQEDTPPHRGGRGLDLDVDSNPVALLSLPDAPASLDADPDVLREKPQEEKAAPP